MWKHITAFLTVFLVVVAAAQQHGGHGGHGGMMPSMAALEGLRGNAFEVAYLSQMIAHHEAAIDMSNGLLRVSRDLVLRDLAWDIKGDQLYEIERMRAWLRAWYGVPPDAAQVALMRADMTGMLGQFTLELNSGDPIRADTAYIEGMLPHHQMALEMARLALGRGVRAELAGFSRNIIVKQTLEIDLMVQFSKTSR